jgi:hypothetical protein
MSDLMRDILMKELNVSMRMLHEDKPLVPRFRIASGDGNFVLFAARQKHLRAQRKCERFIKGFMLWTLARWFVLSQETTECDGAVSFLIARDLCLAVRRKTAHRPRRVAQVEWLDESVIGREIITLLPARSAKIDQRQYQELMRDLRCRGVEVAGPFL